MRYAVTLRTIYDPEENAQVFFETDELCEAKAVAVRLAFRETNLVSVIDTVKDCPVSDLDEPEKR